MLGNALITRVMTKTLMFRVGESESEDLDRRVEEELKSITKMLLGWPNLMISFQKSIQELTLAGKIDKNTADEAIKVVTALFLCPTSRDSKDFGRLCHHTGSSSDRSDYEADGKIQSGLPSRLPY